MLRPPKNNMEPQAKTPLRPLCRALRAAFPLAALALVPAAQAKLMIDGIPDEAEWQSAQVFRDFVVTQPFTLVKPDYSTEARMIGLPEGIAVSFVVEQPKSVPRQRAQTARDADIPGDRVNLFIDFNADGVTAYNFCIGLSGSVQDATMTNETSYSTDWDGDWQYALHEEEDRWTVELLIPWTVASMHDSSSDTRTVAVLFDRVLGVNSQRSASAPASFTRPRFVSDYPHVQIAQFSQSEIHVFPYVSAMHDLVATHTDAKAGADLFWKPSGDFQMAAALNPDFGQVEADQLVVNFDAIETFFSDKRPFFTENQGFFDLATPNSGQLIYTRRIGAELDDGKGVADIDLAVKAIGASGGINYGVLAASEDGPAGKDFYAVRATVPSGPWQFGYIGTYVDRPFLDRRSTVNGVDLNWKPDATLVLKGQVVRSEVREGVASHDGGMEWLQVDLTPSPVWQHRLRWMHFSNDVDFNDMGYLARASLNRLNWNTAYTQNDFAADSSIQSRKWFINPIVSFNDRGDRLPGELWGTIDTTLRSGDEIDLDAVLRSTGVDDLISRGHGNVRLPQRPGVYLNWLRPRRGNWLFGVEAAASKEGLEDWYLDGTLKATWFGSDRFSVESALSGHRGKDWLLWRHDRVFARFDRDQLGLELNLNWLPMEGHELRAKLQWVAVSAGNPRPLLLGADGVLRTSDDAVEPFSVADFGVQLRYRWTFAPQSDFYAVYSRGGSEFARGRDDGVSELFGRATSLRDADQVLFKVRYRF
jgi:hypothetical protein